MMVLHGFCCSMSQSCGSVIHFERAPKILHRPNFSITSDYMALKHKIQLAEPNCDRTFGDSNNYLALPTTMYIFKSTLLRFLDYSVCFL